MDGGFVNGIGRRILMLTLAAGLAVGLCSRVEAQQEPVRTAFPDDSVIAGDTLSRAAELAEGGNPTEAVRVIQQLLLIEPDKVIPTAADRSLFVPVRMVVHAFLLERPELLEKYRIQEEPEALKLLGDGDIEGVERSRFLTTSGLEATLRLAQRRFEAGQFDSARLTLEGVERHPDFAGASAAAVAELSGRIAAYLGRADAKAWAESLGAREVNATVDWPEWLKRPTRSPLHVSAALPTGQIRSTPLTGDAFFGNQALPEMDRRLEGPSVGGNSWIFPTVVGETVIVNDGMTVRALDRSTLIPVWQLRPDGLAMRDYADELDAAGNGLGRDIEDAATVTVSEDIAVATTGVPVGGSRVGDQRVHAMSAIDGTPMWSVDPAWLDSRLEEATVRGPAVIQDGTVVLSLRKQANFRRLTSLYLAGLDLYSGRLLWVRHVASIGSLPWGRTQPRPEALAVQNGIVYRGDEMGVLTAVEAGSGRPKWVRLLNSTRPFDQPYRGGDVPPPRDIVAPIFDGDSLIYLEADGGKIVRLNAADGSVIEVRDASALAGPRYLMKVGEWLVGVGVNRLAYVPLKSLDSGTVRLSPTLPSGGAIGRALATDDSLVIPFATGLVVVDPNAPETVRTVPLSRAGHIVIADGPGSDEPHLLVADRERLYSYISWEAAEARLTARLLEHPADARSLRGFIELANRAGRNDRLKELADRAVALATGPEGDAESQEKLFSLLLQLARAGTPRQTDSDSPLALKQLEDPAHADAILLALERCANTPRQLVDQHLELAAHREAADRPNEAVEAYQRVLEDSSLAAVPLEGPRHARTAGLESRRLLESLLEKTGPGPYATFDAQAAEQLAAIPADADPSSLIAIAERFPAAELGPELWLRISAAASGTPSLASSSVGRALNAARLSERIGRNVDSSTWARVAEAAVVHRAGREAAVYRFLRVLADRDASLAFNVEGAPSDVSAASQSLRTVVGGMASRARVAPNLGDSVLQIISGWIPQETIGNSAVGCPADQIFMSSESTREFGLWAERLEDGRLAPMWLRPVNDADPVAIRATVDESVLFWPSTGGGTLECIDNITGATRWRSIDIADALQGGEAAQRRFPRLSTPLDGTVDSSDLLVANDESTIVLVQRTGRAVAFNLENGTTLWMDSVGAARVFDLQICGDALLISGAGEPDKSGPENGHLTPVLASIGLKSGKPLGTVPASQLGEHVRWIRPLATGDAIVATAAGLLRVQPRTASVVWNIEGAPGAGSAAGWIAGGSLFVLDNESSLWQFRTADGSRSADALDTKGKIDFPLVGETVGDRLIISSSSGVLMYENDGTLSGSDSIHSPGRLMTPQVGVGGIVAIEAFADPAEMQRDDDLPGIRVHVLDMASAKLTDTKRIGLPDSPRDVVILNERILIRVGQTTMVLSGTGAAAGK